MSCAAFTSKGTARTIASIAPHFLLFASPAFACQAQLTEQRRLAKQAARQGQWSLCLRLARANATRLVQGFARGVRVSIRSHRGSLMLTCSASCIGPKISCRDPVGSSQELLMVIMFEPQERHVWLATLAPSPCICLTASMVFLFCLPCPRWFRAHTVANNGLQPSPIRPLDAVGGPRFVCVFGLVGVWYFGRQAEL